MTQHREKKSILLCCSLLLVILVAGAGCTRSPQQEVPAVAASPAQVVSFTGTEDDVSGRCTVLATLPITESPDYATHFLAMEFLTKPEAHAVTVTIVPKIALEYFIVFGTAPASYSCRTPSAPAAAESPATTTITGLVPDTRYYYRACIVTGDTSGPACGLEHTFQTQRSAGSTFTFGVQADSHPEREKTMFSSSLYRQTLQNVAKDRPDFYITLGDDFSIDPLIDKNQATAQNVDAVYLAQRDWLGTAGSSSPIFLVNGNHEQAARYLLDGTATSPAVLAGTARMQYFPQPVPDGFYSGDAETVPGIGLPGDYYAWTWGDALFVVIDPYWHSDVAVDNVAGKNAHQKNDPWGITLGDTQYQWLKTTLEGSPARYKFVFAHHVQGTGRGGIEEAGLYEWGGKDPKGSDLFATKRPGWDLPIQQLMAENGVTIFFQGHDHLFVRQELDGVTYQEVPLPADPTFSMFNADAYTSGTKLPNTGYLRVTVSPQNTTVDYVKTYLPGKEPAGATNGMVAYSYSLTGKPSTRGTP